MSLSQQEVCFLGIKDAELNKLFFFNNFGTINA